MSKHVSRLISSSFLLKRTQPRTAFQNITIRHQTTGDPSKGKGPITWRNLGIITIGGAGFMGFFYYVKNEKEVGKIFGYFNHSVGVYR